MMMSRDYQKIFFITFRFSFQLADSEISNKNKFCGNNVDCCNFDCNLNLTAASHFITAQKILNEITLSTIKKLKRHQKQFKCIKAHGRRDDGKETHEKHRRKILFALFLLFSSNDER